MRVFTIDEHRTVAASGGAVWALLADSASWPSWTSITSFALERPARDDGLGEIRVFTTGPVRVREQIVVRDPERQLSYELLSGLAVRDYRADIGLEPVGGGTEVRWHTRFQAKVPGTGLLYHLVLSRATRDFIDGLSRHAAASGHR